eukprot:TRINITY_DN15434_c0_g1_i8.p1 TRINITY_DN15434_c0_g1~~TRINITY_DN15434_c0_g1_i8.p1  ORF type:complete len:261 (-),score=38.69 TRINITY_DN15434_c0_g1_i8:177-959(-)
MICVEGCVYCASCLSGTVCPNKKHLMGPLQWTWEELKDRADYNHDKIDYIEKYTLMRPSVGKSCKLCMKMVKAGFSCPCGYCVCIEGGREIHRSFQTCINGHPLMVRWSENGKSCVMCGGESHQLWDCQCGFILCTLCEPISHNTKMCPNGHFLERKLYGANDTCFRCFKSRINRLTCPLGYTLCDSCTNELDYGIAPSEEMPTIEFREAEGKCQQCVEHKAAVTFAPCGHLRVCYKCSSYLFQCPFCGVRLGDKEKIIA